MDGILAADWLKPVITPKNLENTVRKLKKILTPHKDKFDTIAFRGLSGTLIGPLLALRMNKQILAVRKDKDGSHSYRKVEGNYASKKYIIIDDFIDTGTTIVQIGELINIALCDETKLVGIALYHEQSLYNDAKEKIQSQVFTSKENFFILGAKNDKVI